MSKITIDQEKCTACATCYSMYPECFEEGEEAKAKVKDHDYKKHGYDKNEIIDSCSGEAITIKD